MENWEFNHCPECGGLVEPVATLHDTVQVVCMGCERQWCIGPVETNVGCSGKGDQLVCIWRVRE
jgi:hypothetical protein